MSDNLVSRLLEKDIQKACVEWARSRGWWARKFSSPANRSVPDYLFAIRIPGRSVKVAVEFKAPGKTSTDAQIEEQEAMRLAGWQVWEIDSVVKFREIFTGLMVPENWCNGSDPNINDLAIHMPDKEPHSRGSHHEHTFPHPPHHAARATRGR